jgi:hypothetical protein
VIGRDFGITTDIQTGPNGNLFVVSLSNGAVYEIKSKPSVLFTATLNGAQETPPNNSTATGTAALLLSPDEKSARLSLSFNGLSSGETVAHVHGPAPPGVSAPPLVDLPAGQVSDFPITLTAAQVQDLKNGLLYINVHSVDFPSGEIRGQFVTSLSSKSAQFSAAGYVVNENAGSVTIGVTRFGNVTTPATINYATSNGAAESGSDYLATSGSLQFAPGETIKYFSVPIVNDDLVERTENINLVLSAANGTVLGSPFTSTITILDDDKPLLATEENGFRAAALDSVTLVRDPFALTNVHNFSVDQRTRIMLFVTGIELLPSENISAVQVQLEDGAHHVFPLVVEDLRPVPNLAGISQLVVRLPESIPAAGDFNISVTFRGVTGNRPLIGLIP